jgi:hypothetical protein
MRLIRCEDRLVHREGFSIETAHKPIEFRQQMRIGRLPALWKHDRGAECIPLQLEQDALRDFLVAYCQLDMSKYGDKMKQTAPIVALFARSAKGF